MRSDAVSAKSTPVRPTARSRHAKAFGSSIKAVVSSAVQAASKGIKVAAAAAVRAKRMDGSFVTERWIVGLHLPGGQGYAEQNAPSHI
jgi:hypothetical protein